MKDPTILIHNMVTEFGFKLFLLKSTQSLTLFTKGVVKIKTTLVALNSAR
jgi:hypothetical protein